MSCEVWDELASHGERLLQEGSPERSRAERHFARCSACAERAFLLDPSWAVRRLDRSGELHELERASFGEDEIAELKRDVLEAGRIRDVESTVRSHRRFTRVVVAAALFAVVVAGGALMRTAGDFWAPSSSRSTSFTAETIAPPRSSELLPTSGASIDLSLPSVGSLAPSAARVYDLGQEDFALVMVVHETLDL